jgi:Zn-dependent protease
MTMVAAAGPLANFALAALVAVAFRILQLGGLLDAEFPRLVVASTVFFNVALGFFNLIPIPPLDGSWVLMRFLPLRHIIVLQQFRLAGMVLIVALLSVPVVANAVLYTPLRFAVRACLGLFGVTGVGIAL